MGMMNGGMRNKLGVMDKPRAEPANKLGDKMMRRVQGSWAQRPGHRQGERRPFPFSTPCSASIRLAEASPELCGAGGGRSSLLVSQLFQALSSLWGHPQALARALSQGHPGRGPSWWPHSGCVWPSPRDRAERGVCGPRPPHSAAAVPCTAIVAGFNPPVIVFYCIRLDITTR